MKVTLLTVVLCMICILSTAPLYADTIILKSGKQIEATIVEKTTEFIRVDIEGIQITYYLDEIETINGERIAVVKEKEPLLETTNQTQPLVSETTEVVPEKPLTGLTDVSEPQAEPSGEFEQPRIKPSTPLPSGLEPKTAAVIVTAFAGMFLFFVVIFIVTYVYVSLCLYFIAKKTQQQPA